MKNVSDRKSILVQRARLMSANGVLQQAEILVNRKEGLDRACTLLVVSRATSEGLWSCKRQENEV
jgi:hypothetical protein